MYNQVRKREIDYLSRLAYQTTAHPVEDAWEVSTAGEWGCPWFSCGREDSFSITISHRVI
jgi:hypothetical protein